MKCLVIKYKIEVADNKITEQKCLRQVVENELYLILFEYIFTKCLEKTWDFDCNCNTCSKCT